MKYLVDDVGFIKWRWEESMAKVMKTSWKGVSHPGNLAKSNSEDLQTSLVSTPELHSDKSLYQESDILLIH